MHAGVVVLCLSLTGCLGDSLVQCDDGRACPVGTACDVAHRSCVDPEQLTACQGAADQESCTTTVIANGRCFDQVCVVAGCGNGFVEADELCDDGNVVSGDGCSAECTSREVCGDGFVDLARGEQCDDSNNGGRDGCTAKCTIEDRIWRNHSNVMPARSQAAAVYLPLQAEAFTYGGNDGNQLLADSWSWNSALWTNNPGPEPPARILHAMTYDPQRGRAILFGGLSAATGLLGDTWEWTGEVWVRVRPTESPSARLGVSLAWDGSRVILFGGSELVVNSNETWAYDGRTWTRLTTPVAPSPRSSAAITYESQNQRVVLFGGGDATTSFADTWTFDGTQWMPLQTTGAPPALQAPRMAYDPDRNESILVGNSNGTRVTWRLAGSTWTNVTPGTSITNAIDGPLVFDEKTRRIIQLGGVPPGTTSPTSNVFTWDGSVWAVRNRGSRPNQRAACSIASDPVRGRIVLFGGSDFSTSTWEWDGAEWKRISVSAPSTRFRAAMSFDPVNRETLLFGGELDTPTFYGDTWTFNGARWLQRSSTGPDARSDAAIATDVRRNRVVLFGGRNASGVLDETWEWDGAIWTRQTPAVSPPARLGARMAYDPIRARVVLFGGGLDYVSAGFDDHWEWDGTTWTQVVLPTQPAARRDHSVVFDRQLRRTLVFGGTPGSPSMWELGDTDWTQPMPVGAPYFLFDACSAYDDARGEIVSFGGTSIGGDIDAMFTVRYAGSVEEVCIAGADGDGDGLTGCEDSDCQVTCEPLCWADDLCP